MRPLVPRHLPLIDVHPHAELAAQAMEEAAAQGRFWELHDKLFDHQDELSREHAIEITTGLVWRGLGGVPARGGSAAG